MSERPFKIERALLCQTKHRTDFLDQCNYCHTGDSPNLAKKSSSLMIATPNFVALSTFDWPGLVPVTR